MENSNEFPKSVTIFNKIQNNYREIHIDGAFGGITPQGLINVSFFAERSPIPKSAKFNVTPQGTVGNQISISEDSKQGIVREFEFGVYMAPHVAVAVIAFLQGQLTILETLKPIPNAPNT